MQYVNHLFFLCTSNNVPKENSLYPAPFFCYEMNDKILHKF